MKSVLQLILFCVITSAIGQQKITVEDIYKGKFYARGVYGINPMKDGAHFSTLENSAIKKFSYKTNALVETIFDATDFSEIEKVSGYEFNSSGSKILLHNSVTPQYRRSFFANYYVYDSSSNSLTKLPDDQIQEVTFSPGENAMAYVKDNNIYVYTGGKTEAITTDGEKNKIINGVCDWVYEEEFAFVRHYQWSKSGRYILYVKFDESQVPEYSMDIFGTKNYPTQQVFKYPKAGEKNSIVSLHLYDFYSKKTKTIKLDTYNDFYIPKITSTEKDDEFAVFISNRHQNKVDVLKLNAESGKTTKWFTETDKAWVETDDMYIEFLDQGNALWSSERDGYRHVYMIDSKGKVKKQITKGKWEVTDIYGYNSDTKKLYYQSNEEGSIYSGVYSIDLELNKTKISTKKGANKAYFSTDFSYYIMNHSNHTTPLTYSLHDPDFKQIALLEDNSRVNATYKELQLPEKEFFTIKNDAGMDMNVFMIKPSDFNENKKYPLLMYVYGGPGSQMVKDSWLSANDFWFHSLAEQGIIVACVDNRGTGGKGAAFKKATYKNLGKYEIEDQIAAAINFGTLPFIDPSRIGMFGWSFGGYMTSLALTKGSHVFKTGIAVAPVTNWRFYDSVYTERFMQTPQENPEGYDDNSPINFAKDLRGNYLIIHGTGDDNVHVQNTMRMAEALTQANKQFDMHLYMDKNHGIYGGNTRIQLFNKMTTYLLNNL